MLKRNISSAEKFTRTVFGIIMIGALIFPWGKWVVAVLGFLFLISAATGYCITCEFYKKYIGKCGGCKIDTHKMDNK